MKLTAILHRLALLGSLATFGCGGSSDGGSGGSGGAAGSGGSGGQSDCTFWCCPEANTGSLQPEVLVHDQHDPCGITLDGSTLFWTRLDGKVVRADVSGGSVKELYDGADFLSCSLAVSPTHVYFSEQDAGRVLRVPRDGGAAEEISTGEGNPGDFVFQNGTVYWVNHTGNQLMSLSDAGGAPAVLAALPAKLAGLAVDSSFAYTLSGDFETGRALYRVPLAGGAPEKLADAQGLGDIAVDVSQAFWTEANLPGRVARSPISGGAAEVVQLNQDLPVAIALDQSSIYFSEGNGISAKYRIWRAPKNGGPPELLVDGQCGPYGLAMDASRLYWTNQYSGTIGSAVK